MQYSFDRTGFPLIKVPKVDLEVHLLPVTKIQFERFLVEPNDFGDTWYENILSLNPRISYRRFTEINREQLFITGVLPEEALSFAQWMGPNFDLPTIDEWRAIYSELASSAADPHQLLSQCQAEVSRSILEAFLTQLCPSSLLDLSLMKNGVVEWVRHQSTWIGLGAPRSDFQPNLWSPLKDEVMPVKLGERVPYFGFRLVRR